MTDLTVTSSPHSFNVIMTFPIIVLGALGVGWVSANRRGRQELITRRPYNNQYSDASAARDERSLLS
ncbi:MAG TPA: hypothetical protein VN845_07350 [Solirubrobacteraceae bacterium]|nr:hypothetical protein [Solirubrobacteraceae bacterium]